MTAPAYLAAQAVACPFCKARPGSACQSTGGGNPAIVAVHSARTRRIGGWTAQQCADAGELVLRVRRGGWNPAVVAGWFATTEAAAAPITARTARPRTPRGVPLSERQAEYIEYAAQAGGRLRASAAHFHGDAAERQTVQALEVKGIVAYVRDSGDGYERLYELTPFGWDVYRQHRLVIRREPAGSARGGAR